MFSHFQSEIIASVMGCPPYQITRFPWTKRPALHGCPIDRDPHESPRFPLNGCLVDRDPSYMGALWTRAHPCHQNLHRGGGGVLLPTACPGTTGVTHPTTREYSPCQQRDPRHFGTLQTGGAPPSDGPKVGHLPTHPPIYRLEPVTRQLAHKNLKA